MVRNKEGEIGFEVLVGGGLGRTPIIGKVIRPFLQKKHLLSYLEAILRVYNRFGRRDNKYKARIKILVKETGIEKFTAMVEEEWCHIKDELILNEMQVDRIKEFFTPPTYEADAANDASLDAKLIQNAAFATWIKYNTTAHKIPGYTAVYLSLKPANAPPGDITEKQLDAVADLADKYSFGLIRSTHRQNLLFGDVKQSDLYELWQKLSPLNLATPNIGTLTDMICCPGLDFCSLANASSIPIADEINQLFDDIDYVHDLGDIKINMSGCMNGCAHQSVGNIGILGVDKKGAEWYQLTVGGSSENDAALGDRLGPAVAKDKVVGAIESILNAYTDQRIDGESFLQTVKRTGIQPFKERVYANN